MRAQVGDFGIAIILNEGASEASVNFLDSIRIRGTIGYVASGNLNVLLLCLK
jgi:hypothetical protein